MNNSEQLLIITISINNKNDNCEIPLTEVESIEKIKEICKQKLGFESIDINKINLCFIDDDKEKIIINEFDDLIKYSNTNSENNLSIKLIAEIIKENESIIDNINKENNLNDITNNSENRNKIINDYKDRIINKLNAEIENLKMKCKEYKDIIKNLIDKYEKIISGSSKVDSKKENAELTYKNNININDKPQNENNNNLNSNNINKNEKKILAIKDMKFIDIECNKCKKKNYIKIFQCVSCENYYLCQDCYYENNITTQRFHEHKYLYFFEIVFPVDLMSLIKKKEEKDKIFIEIIDKFNDILNSIFFDKNGNFSNTKYVIDNSHINKLKSMFDEMNKINEDPFQYFEDYRKSFINPKLQMIEKEGNQKDVKPLINEKANLLWINLMSCSPNKKAFTK